MSAPTTAGKLDALQFRINGLTRKTLRISYNYCSICGRVPETSAHEPNYAPIRFWDCDDGWKIGTLCHWCHDDIHGVEPKPSDYACSETNGVCDNDPETDEDSSMAL